MNPKMIMAWMAAVGTLSFGCAGDLPLGADGNAAMTEQAMDGVCPAGLLPTTISNSAFLSSAAFRKLERDSVAFRRVDSGIFGPNSVAFADSIARDVAEASTIASSTNTLPVVIPGVGTGVLGAGGVATLTGLFPGTESELAKSFARDDSFARSTAFSAVNFGVFGPDSVEFARETVKAESERSALLAEADGPIVIPKTGVPIALDTNVGCVW